jgi:transcriptional regulator with XRE-family HTH domain
MSIAFTNVIEDLIRTLRASRSQLALSRRLHFRTNVVYSWEHGRRHPSATQLLTLAERVGVDLRQAFRSLYPVKSPTWLDQGTSLSSVECVAAVLKDARGGTPLVHLAELTGCSRFALARWQSAEAEPRAWEFLAVLHYATHRLTDFLDALTGSRPLPSLQQEYKRVHHARLVAERYPVSQALLRCLELESYSRRVQRQEVSFAAELDITKQEEQEILGLLRATGQIRRYKRGWRVLRASPLNMRLHRETAHLQRVFWANLASRRAPAAKDGLCAYNVCGVSAEGYEALRLLQREYLQKARAIIEKSEPVERVALLQVNLVALVKEVTEP